MMTELYLEQVLIGALGMSIALLPWLADIRNELRGIDAGDAVAVGSAALGVAFWLGIPLDRLAAAAASRPAKGDGNDRLLTAENAAADQRAVQPPMAPE